MALMNMRENMYFFQPFALANIFNTFDEYRNDRLEEDLQK